MSVWARVTNVVVLRKEIARLEAEVLRLQNKLKEAE